jgi:hypothetical protein
MIATVRVPQARESLPSELSSKKKSYRDQKNERPKPDRNGDFNTSELR